MATDSARTELDVPDGMALACKVCGWRPGETLSMGVVAAHFETEHDSTDVRLELVVLCSRCDKPMQFERTEQRPSSSYRRNYGRPGTLRDIFNCLACHRTRTILRTDAA